MAHDVFISHSAQDKAVADLICHGLERDGVRCWIAPRDIAPGLSWAAAIQKAVRESRALVLIFSGAADRSDHVRREVSAALEAGATIVPFRLEDIRAGDELNYYLAGLHWLDATTPPLDQHVRRLSDNLRALLDGRPETVPADIGPRRAAPQWSSSERTPRRGGGAAAWLWALVALAALFILPIVALVWWGIQAAGDTMRTVPGAATAVQAAPAQAGANAARPDPAGIQNYVEQATRDAMEQARQAQEAARAAQAQTSGSGGAAGAAATSDGATAPDAD